MNSNNYSAVQNRRSLKLETFVCLGIALFVAWVPSGEVCADPGYHVKSGKVTFNVESNIAFLKVSGSSSVVKGKGEATVAGNAATIQGLRFELDPKTFKMGMGLRDEHLYEKVFTAADGSIPPVVLQADRFEAVLNPKTSKWEGMLQARLTIRGVTKPVSFRASLEKEGNGAVVAAEGNLNTSAFGVKPITYSGATVNDDVAVTVSNLRIEP